MPVLTRGGPIATITRHRSTLEHIGYTFDSVTVDGEAVAPPTEYQMAAPVSGTQPTEWHPAPWLVGPMTPGVYDLYLRFTDTPEIPVRFVARLWVQ
jgi:hypothetical protein